MFQIFYVLHAHVCEAAISTFEFAYLWLCIKIILIDFYIIGRYYGFKNYNFCFIYQTSIFCLCFIDTN